MDNKYVKIHGTKTIYESNFIKLNLVDLDYYGHRIEDYNVVEFKGVSVVVIVEKDDSILLTENYRFVVDKFSTELICGGVEEGEDILDAARREVFEETGIKIKNEKIITEFYPCNGLTTQRVVVVYAQFCEGELKAQKEELINAYFEERSKVKEKLRNNGFHDGETALALYKYFEVIGD